MARCKNCNKSIPEKSDRFCTDKCRREYREPTEKEYDNKACFNLLAAAIESIFTNRLRHTDKQIDRNKKFLKSPVVASFCDCSHNFNQDKLIKEYAKLISSSTKNSKHGAEQIRVIPKNESREDSNGHKIGVYEDNFMPSNSTEVVERAMGRGNNKVE